VTHVERVDRRQRAPGGHHGLRDRDTDLTMLLREATGHAVEMRDAVAAGYDRVHPGDRALILVDILNRPRAAAGIDG
jgi:hypothetical protein